MGDPDQRTTMQLASAPPAKATQHLRPWLHERIEKMDARQLQAVEKFMAQMEIDALADKLGVRFDALQEKGALVRIPELVREHRATHPYR
jgi:hypothetical protein